MAELPLPRDYEDLLREFVRGDVEFLLIGGWAVAVYGHGRATDDLDVFVRATPDNAKKVFAALEHFGAPLSGHGVTEAYLAKNATGIGWGASRCSSRSSLRSTA